MTHRPVIRKLRRDSVLFLFGLGGLAYQMITGQVNTAMVIVCALMAGVPGAAGLVSLLSGRPEPTNGSASPSQPGSSPPSSLPGSSTSTEVERAP